MQRTARWVSLAVLAVLVVAIVVSLLPDDRDSEILDDRVDRAFAKECKEFRRRMGSLAYDGTTANQVAAACAKRGY
jgi:hypothetical protein